MGALVVIVEDRERKVNYYASLDRIEKEGEYRQFGEHGLQLFLKLDAWLKHHDLQALLKVAITAARKAKGSAE
jgi:L-amino acid N-acyltransferase YncA